MKPKFDLSNNVYHQRVNVWYFNFNNFKNSFNVNGTFFNSDFFLLRKSSTSRNDIYSASFCLICLNNYSSSPKYEFQSKKRTNCGKLIVWAFPKHPSNLCHIGSTHFMKWSSTSFLPIWRCCLFSLSNITERLLTLWNCLSYVNELILILFTTLCTLFTRVK